MKISMTSSGNWNKTLSFLESSQKKSPTRAMNAMGSQGVTSLRNSTPRKSGATANGWNYKVESNKGLTELSFYNSAYPNLPVNIALLIQYGHGTGTGGYVPARPFIKQAVDSIMANAGDRLVKEMIN